MSAPYVLTKLLGILWTHYKKRVTYAATYQSMVEERGGHVENDHLAFRTLNCPVGSQPAGAEAIARVFVPLGYEKKDKYIFEDKKLTAWHWEHKTNVHFPKVFISQLEVDQLSKASAGLIKAAVSGAPDLLMATDEELLGLLAQGRTLRPDNADALAANLAKFFTRPWQPPLRKSIEVTNTESQYAAWTLLHGNSVNHFTAYINKQHVKEWPDLETTVAALRKAGLPMKEELEGARGSKLRQSSTEAADDLCEVTEDNGLVGMMPWSYAYYELAERGVITGIDGKPTRFQGFLGAQATNLFDMTKRS